MAFLPSYLIQLISFTVSAAAPIEQLSDPSTVGFGRNNTTQKMGQTFLTVGAFYLEKIILKLYKVNNPTDNLIVKLYASDKSTLLATSSTVLDMSTLSTATGGQEIEFFFDIIELNAATTYFFSIERSGVNDNNNYPIIKSDSANPYSSGQAFRWDQDITTWVSYFSHDIWFKITGLVKNATQTKDITCDVQSIRVNRGQNEVDGNLKEGVVDLVLDNGDLRYTLTNASSDLFGLFRILAEIKITATYSAVTYDIFRGFIRTIDPNLLIKDQQVIASVVDRFYLLKEEITNTGLLAGKTADEIIEEVLLDIGLTASDYDLDPDAEVLEDITFTDANAFESVALAVEVGQHHHFIAPDGKYTFKINTWLSSNTPKYTFNWDDGIVDGAVIPIEHDGIKNKVKIKWGVSNYAIKQDTASQLKYELKEFILENELMPASDDEYATFIAEYILGLFKEPGDGLQLELSNEFPEVLDIDIGDTIRFIHTPQSIDEIYTVVGITHNMSNMQNHKLTTLCRKWIVPPVPIERVEPFAGDAFTALDDDSLYISQGIKQAAAFKVYSVFMRMKSNLDNNKETQMEIHAADGSGFPTGAALATSNLVIVESGVQDKTYNFSFPTDERPNLSAATQYTLKVKTPKTDQIYLPGINNQENLSAISSKTKFAMSFQLPQKGDMYQLQGALGLVYNTDGQKVTAAIHADSAGFPGALIQAADDDLSFPSGFNNSNYQFGLSFTPAVTLQKNTTYWIVYERITSITWTARGEKGNPYANGQAAAYDGSWALLPAGEDAYFKLNMYDFINKWEIWGKTGNPYTDGIAAEQDDGGSWSSLDPVDFWFILEKLV
jgi:hypothetical protein